MKNIEETTIIIHDINFLDNLPNLKKVISSDNRDYIKIRKINDESSIVYETHVNRKLFNLEHTMTDAISIIDSMTQDMHDQQIQVSGEQTSDPHSTTTTVHAEGWVKLDGKQIEEMILLLAVSDFINMFLDDRKTESYHDVKHDENLQEKIQEIFSTRKLN